MNWGHYPLRKIPIKYITVEFFAIFEYQFFVCSEILKLLFHGSTISW